MRIQIAPQIENHPLFEGIVQNYPERVEAVLKQKRHESEQHQRQQFFRMMLAHDIVDDPFGHARENDHHQRADDGAPERAERERRITLQVTKHAPDRFHSRAKLSQLALCNIWVDRPLRGRC